MTKQMKQHIGHYMRLYLLLALFISPLSRLWAQDTPPNGTPVVTLTVLDGKSIALQAMVSGEQAFWVETAPGVFQKQTMTDGGWSSRQDFLSSGTTMKVYGNFIGFDIRNNSDNITGIDVTECPNLSILIVSNNQISSLNLSNNRLLSHLSCDGNKLTSLDVSQNIELGWLDCSKNQLSELDISRNVKLNSLICYLNLFTSDDLNAIYGGLPLRISSNAFYIMPAYNVSDANISDVLGSNAQIAKNKLWDVKYANYLDIPTTGTGVCENTTPPAETPYVTLTLVKESGNINYLHMGMSSTSENTLMWIETFPGKFHKMTVGKQWDGLLTIALEDRTSIKVFGNLTGLNCAANGKQITGIDLSSNPGLQELNCANNPISTLTIGVNSQLTKLIGYNIALNRDKLYCSLPTRTADDNATIYLAESSASIDINAVLASNANIAKDKGWKVLFAENEQEIATTGTQTCDQLTPPANAKAISISLGGSPFDEPIDENIDLAIRLKAAEENTPVWIELRSGEYQFVSVGTSFTEVIPLQATTKNGLKIYGDVTGFDCNKNDGIGHIDLTNNPLVEELGASEIYTLMGITLSPNSNMKLLSIYDSNLDVNKLFCQLPARSATDNAIVYLVERVDSDLTGLKGSLINPKIASEKGWQVLCLEDMSDVVLPDIMTCNLLAPSPTTPSVTLTLTQLSEIPDMPERDRVVVSMKAAADNTLVWVDFGLGKYFPLLVNAEWTTTMPMPILSGSLKIFGDITGLDCSKNRPYIHGVDISKNPLIVELDISDNFICNLDVSANTNLKRLVCNGTNLKVGVLNKIYCDLPAMAEGESGVIIPALIDGDDNIDNVKASNAGIARDKGWAVNFAAEGGAIPTTGTTTCEELIPPANAPVISMSVMPIPMDGPFLLKGPMVSPMVRFSLLAATDNTPAWIETAPGMFEQITVGTAPMSIVLPTTGFNAINIYGKVTNFNCAKNYISITSINVSGNTLLEELICDETFIGSLNLSKNTALTHLNCSRTQINTLDLTHNTALTHLTCNDNRLNTLNVRQNTKLEYLQIINNQTTELDLSHNPELEYLDCSRNSLTSLSLSNNSKLTHIEAYSNLFSTTAIDGIYCSLPTRETGAGAKFVLASTEPDYDMTSVMATNAKNAQDKGWAVVGNDNSPISTTGSYTCGAVGGVRLSNSTLTMLTGKEHTLNAIVEPVSATNQSVTWTSSNTAIATVTNGLVTAVSVGATTITANTAEGGYSATCEVTVMDALPANTPVITITTQENVTIPNIALIAEQPNTPLWIEASSGVFTHRMVNDWTDINNIAVSGSTLKVHGAITGFACENNYDKVIAIDISGNAGLKELYCPNNAITSLDAGQNPVLSTLFIANNPLSTHALDNLYCSLPYIEEPNRGMLIPVASATDANHAAVVASNTNIAKAKNWNVAYLPNMGMPGMLKMPIQNPIPSTGTYKCGSVYEVLISETSKTIKADESFTLTANVLPVNADNMEVTWSSSNPAVATVADDVVTGVAIGTATITVTTVNGGFTASCEVTVTSATGIENAANETLLLYPNPTRGEVYLGGINATERVDVYSMMGTLVFSTLAQPNQPISLADLKPGMYLMKVNGQTLKITKH